MSSNVQHQNVATSVHEIETFLSVQSRLAKLRSGMEVRMKGPLTEELERLSALPFVSFPIEGHKNDKKGVNISIAKEEAGTLQNPDVDLILKKSTPSAFGKGEQTVMDENYRSGREIQGADIELVPDWTMNIVHDIEAKVSATMFAGRTAIPKLYKLAIYKEGGHFDWHMDSTHSDEHHATVLVALNTSWVGGDLLLRRNGVETRVDLKPKVAKKGLLVALQAVAFYTDTEHKVEPVSQGIRIVLQYDVEVKGWSKENDRKHGREDENENEDSKEGDEGEDDSEEDNGEEDDEEDEDEDESPLERVESIYHHRRLVQRAGPIGGDPTIIKNIMVIIQKMLKSGVEELGFATQYLYRKSSLLPEFLKGADAVLYQALVATFDVSLHPIVLQETSGYEGGYRDDRESTCYAFRFGSKGTGGLDADPASPDDVMSTESDTDDESDAESTSSTMFYLPKVSALKMISSEDYIEHTGNEAQLAEHKYFGGGMFVRIRKTD
jgi:hypothetical protein